MANPTIPQKITRTHKANLNSEKVMDAGWSTNDLPYVPYSRNTDLVSEDISVHFDGLEDALIREIEQADLVLGCVAWLTNSRILDALASKDVFIVVQKEDFLRPDMFNTPDWKSKLRSQYDALKCMVAQWEIPGGEKIGQSCLPWETPIRCMGNYNRDKVPASPRMHHKFIVLARLVKWFRASRGAWQIRYKRGDAPQHYKWSILARTKTILRRKNQSTSRSVSPYAVWTGSFNFTQNAVMSLENAVVIRLTQIVDVYVKEFIHVLLLSEPLDWRTDWVEPEYRIGT